MSADIDRLFNNARIQLPGALDAVLKLEFFNVLDDFYQGSNSWQEDVTFPVDPNFNTYVVASDTPSAVIRLQYVVDGDGRGVPCTTVDPGTIVLNGAPPADSNFTATVILTVDDPVDSDGLPAFPAWTLTQYFSAILDGLLARMMAHPAKPYSNPALALFHERKFRAAIAQARNDSIRKNLDNAQAWAFPQSFAVRRR